MVVSTLLAEASPIPRSERRVSCVLAGMDGRQSRGYAERASGSAILPLETRHSADVRAAELREPSCGSAASAVAPLDPFGRVPRRCRRRGPVATLKYILHSSATRISHRSKVVCRRVVNVLAQKKVFKMDLFARHIDNEIVDHDCLPGDLLKTTTDHYLCLRRFADVNMANSHLGPRLFYNCPQLY